MLDRLLAALTRHAPLRLWAMCGAAPALTAFACWITYIVWRGGWAAERQEQQLFYLGVSLFGTLVLIGLIVVALTAVKFSGRVGGASIEVDGNEAGPAP